MFRVVIIHNINVSKSKKHPKSKSPSRAFQQTNLYLRFPELKLVDDFMMVAQLVNKPTCRNKQQGRRLASFRSLLFVVLNACANACCMPTSRRRTFIDRYRRKTSDFKTEVFKSSD